MPVTAARWNELSNHTGIQQQVILDEMITSDEGFEVVKKNRNHYYSVVFDKEFVKMKIKKFFQQVTLPVEQIQELVKESIDFDEKSEF